MITEERLPDVEQARIAKFRARGLQVNLQDFQGSKAHGNVKYELFAPGEMGKAEVERLVEEVNDEINEEFPHIAQTSTIDSLETERVVPSEYGSGETVDTDEVIAKMLDRIEHAAEHLSAALETMTPHEKEVAHIMATKFRDKVIALIDEARQFETHKLRELDGARPTEQFKIAVEVAGLLSAFQYVQQNACKIALAEGGLPSDIQDLLATIQDEMTKGAHKSRTRQRD